MGLYDLYIPLGRNLNIKEDRQKVNLEDYKQYLLNITEGITYGEAN